MVVIFDMLNTICRDMIRLIKNDEKLIISLGVHIHYHDKPKLALGATIALLVSMVVICLINLLINVLIICKRDKHDTCYKTIKILIIILQSTAVCCYFFGDNFYYVVDRYEKCQSKCGKICIKKCYYTAIALLASAAILYAIVKLLQLVINDNSGRSKAKEEWINFLPMIAVIAEMDLLYTIATSKLPKQTNSTAAIAEMDLLYTSKLPKQTNGTASWFLLVMAIIIGISLIIGKFWMLYKKIDKWNHPINNNPIDGWIEKLDNNIITDIGEWNIPEAWRGLPDQLNENKFIQMIGDVNNNNNFEEIQAGHNNIVKILQHKLIDAQYYLAKAQENPNEDNLKKLRNSLTVLNDRLKAAGGLVTDPAADSTLKNFKFLIKWIAMFILIVIPLMLHTLGDNLEPLDSIKDIKCDSKDCKSEESCKKNSEIRICLALISLLCIFVPASYCFANWLMSLCRPSTQDEMDKWVMYKQQYTNLNCYQKCACCWWCIQPLSEESRNNQNQEDEESRSNQNQEDPSRETTHLLAVTPNNAPSQCTSSV